MLTIGIWYRRWASSSAARSCLFGFDMSFMWTVDNQRKPHHAEEITRRLRRAKKMSLVRWFLSGRYRWAIADSLAYEFISKNITKELWCSFLASNMMWRPIFFTRDITICVAKLTCERSTRFFRVSMLPLANNTARHEDFHRSAVYNIRMESTLSNAMNDESASERSSQYSGFSHA